MGKAKKTQGTQLYFLDEENSAILKVANTTSIDGIDSPNDQIETTPLEGDDREYLSGLATPGQASFGVNTNFDEAETENHYRLYELKQAGVQLQWYLGWGDGKDIVPTYDSGTSAVTLPTTRTWLAFKGNLQNFPFSFALNDVVKSACTIQLSGAITPSRKAAA